MAENCRSARKDASNQNYSRLQQNMQESALGISLAITPSRQKRERLAEWTQPLTRH
jgi:hypothetical protein